MTGIIEDYLSYASRLTDAPIEYHRAAALTLTAASVGPTPIDTTPRHMFPHTWNLPLGRAGDRKTTSIEILDSVMSLDIPRLANEYSKEGLIAEVAEKPHAVGLLDECGGTLKNLKNNRHYNTGLDDIMCSLYSKTGEYKRKLRSETFTINKPCLTLMWATTFKKFRRNVSVDDWTSGFLGRFQIVYAERQETLPRRNIDAEDTRRLKELKDKAQDVYDCFHANKLSFKFDEAAFKLIGKWQTDKESVEYDNEDVNDTYAAVSSRMGDYLTKDSALFEVDRLSSKVGSSLSTRSLSNLVNSPIVISVDSVQKSMDYNDNLLSVLSNKILNKLSETEISRDLVRLSKVVCRCAKPDGWAERQDVLPRMNLKANQFEEILQTAMQSGEIECQTRERKQLLRVIVGAE